MKLLIVEDDRELLRSLLLYFHEYGYNCESSKSLRDAHNKICDHNYDCFLIDLSLPDGNGMELIEKCKRRDNSAGIIVLSANSNLDNKIESLEKGADDYLTKPFHLSELNARIKSVIRRKKQAGNLSITFHEITIDPEAKSVMVNEQEVKLTKREYDLLLYFVYNKNKVVTKASISEHLWGDFMDVSDATDALYSHLKNLKKKLKAAGCEDYIQMVYGVGYIFKSK
ncbi:MAG: response regulator transcription factor [Crocinitomicaceae bacterium]